MRRKITMALLVLACFLLQTTIFQALEIADVAPNLLLILTISFGFMQGKKQGIILGFFCGLLIDIFHSDFLGLYALIYMYLGYFSGFFCRVFFDEDIKMPMLLVAVGDVVYGILVFLTQFLMRGRVDFIAYTKAVIIPEMVYTVLITIILYRVFYKINKILVRREARGSLSLWLRN